MKKILFCTPAPLTKSLGAAKVVVELAEEMERLDWSCRLLCPADIAEPNDPTPQKNFAVNLRTYLKANAGRYDVVDYDHEYLPYARSAFDPQTLFVARSVLLAQHLDQIAIPTGRSLRSRVGDLIKGKARQQRRQERICRAQATVEEADLINVSNNEDKEELMRRGVAGNRIVVLPYGISRTRRPLFDQISSALPPQPVVAFVGTFDYRKGAYEFPEIVRRIVTAVPEVSFKLMGTKGLFQTEAAVRAPFAPGLQSRLTVLPTYAPDELPQMLSSCSVGIFPSHMEGFGFGVLEMLAASVPVIAYNAPGPPMMLPAEYLVPRGDADALARKVTALLQDQSKLAEARIWAKQQSQPFDWKAIAQETETIYCERLLKQQSAKEMTAQ